MTNDELLSYLDRPFLFWSCSEHPSGTVTWIDDRARCDECGHENHRLSLRGVFNVIVIAGNHREFVDYFLAQEVAGKRYLRSQCDVFEYGHTRYHYLSSLEMTRGLNPASTSPHSQMMTHILQLNALIHH
jgi:hypothetical protein